jgi:iron(III) transport system permease protein
LSLAAKVSKTKTSSSFAAAPKYLLIFSFLTVLLVAIPLIYVVVRSSENGIAEFFAIISRPRSLQTLLTSLFLALAVAIGSLILGVLSALLLGKTNVLFRRFLLILMPLPLAIPSYVIAYSYLSIYPFLKGFWISVLILSLATFPFVAIPTYALLRRMDLSQEEVARSLGMSPLKVLSKVIWPQVRVASIAGALLSALYALSDFGTVSLMRLDTFTRVIYTMYRATFDRSGAASLALLLLTVSIFVVWLERKARGRVVPSRVGSGTSRVGGVFEIGFYRYAATIFIFIIYTLTLLIPGYVLISRALNLGTSIDTKNLIQVVFNTSLVAFLGATIALLLALPVGILSARFKSKFATWLENGLFITHALPGVVVGLSLVALGAKYLPVIYQTIFLLAFAYALLFIANSLGAIRSSLAKIPNRLDEVSRSLGHNFSQTLRKVILPIAAPGVFSGWLLVFVTAMKELPATLMLKPTGFETLSTSLWTATSISQYAQAAPYALALIFIASIPSYLLNRPNLAERAIMRENS